jgi:ubiquinone/menaquinone biosynthesis C-methylase UbiE
MKHQDSQFSHSKKTFLSSKKKEHTFSSAKKVAKTSSPFRNREDTKSLTGTARSVSYARKVTQEHHEKKPKTASDTSWGGVADWYNKHLESGDDTYHSKIIFPNLLRILGDISGKKVLDMACGQGIFSEKLRDGGALVTGVDLGKQLIKIAEEKSLSIKQKGTHKVTYHVASTDDMFMIKDTSFDIVVCILALQNIENLQKTIGEASRVLAPQGKLLFVLNHPSFRNPRKTFWGYNEEDDTQYRRVDEYMSESHIKIDMTPGRAQDKKFTVSFHRPLQVYVKALSKAGFSVTRLEEWVSHKESERGPKKHAEDKSRKEIPMFMCIEGRKVEGIE